jgi:hypothetical protein
MTLYLVSLFILVVILGSFTTFLSERETKRALGFGAVLGFLAAIFFPAHEHSEFVLKFFRIEIQTKTDGYAFTFLAVFISASVLWWLLRKGTGAMSESKTTAPVGKTH